MYQIKEVDGIPINKLRGLVIPDNPLGDKVLAVWIFIHLLGLKLENLELVTWGGGPEGNRPSDEREAAWKAGGFYCVDVGHNRYHDEHVGQPRAGSACEMVLRQLGLIEAASVTGVFRASHEWLHACSDDCGHDPELYNRLKNEGLVRTKNGEVDALAELRRRCTRKDLLPYLEFALAANRNNATGFLKEGGKYTLFYLVREMARSGASAQEVLAVGHIVINAYYFARRPDLNIVQIMRQLGRRLMGTTVGREARDIPEIAEYLTEELAGGEPNPKFLGGRVPFSVGLLIQDLYRTGWSIDEICKWANWWLKQIAEMKAAMEICGVEWESSVCRQEFFADKKGLVIYTDNQRMARWVFRKFGGVRVLVVRGSKGNVAILSRGVELDLVASVLTSREPDRWFFDSRIGAILNGGHMHGQTVATEIDTSEIVRLVDWLGFGVRFADGRAIHLFTEDLGQVEWVAGGVGQIRCVMGTNKAGQVGILTDETVGLDEVCSGLLRRESGGWQTRRFSDRVACIVSTNRTRINYREIRNLIADVVVSVARGSENGDGTLAVALKAAKKK